MTPAASLRAATAQVADTRNTPGGYCQQCHGSLIRLDGELRCGRCGWPLGQEIPKPPPTMSVLDQNGDLRRRNQALIEENELLREENEALRKAVEGKESPASPAPPLHTDLMPAAESNPTPKKAKGR